MKQFLLAAGLLAALSAQAADTLYVRQQKIPLLIERQDNVLMQLRIHATETRRLDEVTLRFADEVPLQQIKSVKLYYSGTDARQDYLKERFAPAEYISSHKPGQTRAANPSYSILKSEAAPQRTLTLKGGQPLFPGYNFFWVSLELQPQAPLDLKITADIAAAKADGKEHPVKTVSAPVAHRVGVGVRHAGDDGSAAFRIPGLVTTNKGTLLGVYDVRYNSSVDLQEHVDIGLSRSTDGGKTWEKMRLPLAFGEEGGLPSAQNGVGDPSILVDTKTNTVWIVSAWTHGMGN